MTGRRALLLATAALVAVLVTGSPAPARQDTDQPDAELVEEGRVLYTTGCSSCHGLRAEGSDLAPGLRGVGAASIDFYVSTGRMPLKEATTQAVRKPPSYDMAQTAAIVAYVTSLGEGGPPIPRPDVAGADLQEGGELYRSNCAACHGAAAIGGALASGRRAPALRPATPVQIAEAVRIGPGAMPQFGPETFDDAQLDDLVRYVEHLDNPRDPGGSGLGRVGPIPEGFVGWLVGLGVLLGAAYWIGERE